MIFFLVTNDSALMAKTWTEILSQRIFHNRQIFYSIYFPSPQHPIFHSFAKWIHCIVYNIYYKRLTQTEFLIK